MVDKYHDLDSKVKYETIYFPCLLRSSGALEAGTNTIKMTAETANITADVNAGVNPTVPVTDGSKFSAGQTIILYDTASPTHIEKLTIGSIATNNLVCTGTLTYTYPTATGKVRVGYLWTLPANTLPTDNRLIITRRAVRAMCHINSFSGTAQLNYRLYLDLIDADHMIMDSNWTGAAADNFAVADVIPTSEGGNSMQNATFLLLNDTNVHTMYLVLWVAGTNAVIADTQLWTGIGVTGVTSRRCFIFTYTGQVQLACATLTVKYPAVSGYPNYSLNLGNSNAIYGFNGSSFFAANIAIVNGSAAIATLGGAATELAYFNGLMLFVRGES